MKHCVAMLKLCLILLVLTSASMANAENVKGKIVSAETGEPLARAVVHSVVYFPNGGNYQDRVETDSTGCFNFTAKYEGRIVLTFDMLGYKFLKKVNYVYGPMNNETLDLGTLKLRPTTIMLNEVHVTAKVPRMTMSGDTIVFNPSAFKLKEGDRLEELIRKLPGVEQRNGALYWNNKPLRLMVNGQNVFGGDGIIGQLPAEVADKIKLYDRKSELSRHTGKDDGNENNVLDIQIKSGFLDRWYGWAEGNYVTGNHYMGKLQANLLSDKNPQILYFKANNENQLVERTDGKWVNSLVDKFGKDIFGAYNYEHNWKTKGLNGYTNNHFDVSASFGHADGWGATYSNKETFFDKEDHMFSMTRDQNKIHTLKPKLFLELFAYTDAKNSVLVNAEALYEKKHTLEESDVAKFVVGNDGAVFDNIEAAMSVREGDKLYDRLVNRNRYYTTSDQQQRRLKTNYQWTHYIANKGQFSLNGNTTIEGLSNETYINRQLEYLRDRRSENLVQYSDNPTNSFATQLQATFAYWISGKVMLQLQDFFRYSYSHESRDFFSDTQNEINPEKKSMDKPTTIDVNNSMDYKNYILWNAISTALVYNPSKKIQIVPVVTFYAMRDKGDLVYGQLDTAAVNTDCYVDPSLNMKWKIGRDRNMNISFAYQTKRYSTYYKLQWRDASDPMYVTCGNPGLKYTHNHTTMFNYNRMWLRKQITLSLTASYSKDINAASTLYRYDSKTGAYTSSPINVKGGDTYSFAVNYTQGFGVDIQLKNKVSGAWKKSYGYLTIVDNATMPELNKQNLFSLNDNFELAYETKKVQTSLFADVSYNRYRYADQSYNSNPLYLMYGCNARLKLSAFSINARVWDDFRTGYKASTMNRHRLMSRAGISYTFNKQKCRIGIVADDIFNQARDFSSTYNAYERSEKWSETFHHYIGVDFMYQFDAKAKKKTNK